MVPPLNLCSLYEAVSQRCSGGCGEEMLQRMATDHPVCCREKCFVIHFGKLGEDVKEDGSAEP